MLRAIEVKSILNKTKRRDNWFLDDYTLNLYSGCSMNCSYCYIRGSQYGINLESSLSYKSNALEILEKQLTLRARKKQYGIIVISSATDPYVSLEKKLGLTRQALELICKYRFPVHIVTKSDQIIRDLDVLEQINREAILPGDLNEVLKDKCIISFSFSCLDDSIGKIFEPGAPSPSARWLAMCKVLDAGFLCGISLMPLLPFISDTTSSLHKIFSEAKNAKVKYIFPASLSLYGKEKADSKTLSLQIIKKHFPELLPRYIKYFEKSDSMPEYYKMAFNNKMHELSQEYCLPLRIL